MSTLTEVPSGPGLKKIFSLKWNLPYLTALLCLWRCLLWCQCTQTSAEGHMNLSSHTMDHAVEECSWHTLNWPGLHHLHWDLEWFLHYPGTWKGHWSLIQMLCLTGGYRGTHYTSWIQLKQKNTVLLDMTPDRIFTGQHRYSTSPASV